mmetsp:Transcript_45309/g.95060  ORF Transcript_45309/g.95060 Transcript_45309/m.95060 type:complete len:683 (+) Transcript_45309:177-2225(+)
MVRSSSPFLASLLLVVAANYHVESSPSPSRNPSSVSPSFLPSASPSKNNVGESSTTTIANAESTKKVSNPSRPKTSSVTFLYELYEHEIYNPETDSWTSRRFTQSPITGGGGRDSTSLDPQACAPPRNYLFDGEWKIDMASESRDGFGWEYYVGRYDGLGRRRRRWVRSLMRVSSSMATAKKKTPVESKKRKPTTKSTPSSSAKETKKATNYPQPNLFRAIRNQYNFKGFGWSFYKSFLYPRSVGASLRIPLSANFDSYDQYLAAPYISSATYFGYPWVVATFLNASLPIEAIKWVLGGILWKIQWGVAVISAFIRGFVEAAIWIALWPWRLWMTSIQAMSSLGSRFGLKKQDQEIVHSIDNDITTSIIESDEGMDVSIETHIELSNTSEYKDTGGMQSVSATAVIDSPRGGATNTTTEVASFRKKHLTILGNEIPTFHRPYSIEYSTTIQERIGVCISWRMSSERGYEFRSQFFYTCLPTLLFWGQLEEERKKRMNSLRRYKGIWGKRPSSVKYTGAIESDEKVGKDTGGSESKSLSSNRFKSQSKPPVLASFLSDHSSALGISAGWPLPVHPHFNCSLLLSLSGFYYGWLLKFIRSLFVLPLPKLLDEKATESSVDSDKSEKLVSSALKSKLPFADADDLGETTDDEASLPNSASIDLLESDAEDNFENTTSTNVNVGGV